MQNDPLYVESEDRDLKVEEQLTKQLAATKNVGGEPYTSREVGTEYFSKQHRLKVEAPAHQEMSHSVGVQSQKASGSLHERNMQNNNKMGGAHDLIRKPIRSENCSSDQHQRCGETPLRVGKKSDEPHQW